SRWYAFGEALFTKVSDPSLLYGRTSVATTVGTVTNTTSEDLFLTNRWSTGFRVGLGYRLPCDMPRIQTSWTHITSRASDTRNDATTPPAGTTVQFFNTFFVQAPFTSSVNWHLKYDMVDFDVIQDLNCWNCFTFSPFIGVRNASIRQNAHYLAADATAH